MLLTVLFKLCDRQEPANRSQLAGRRAKDKPLAEAPGLVFRGIVSRRVFALCQTDERKHGNDHDDDADDVENIPPHFSPLQGRRYVQNNCAEP
jgi:hypothetical protein